MGCILLLPLTNPLLVNFGSTHKTRVQEPIHLK